MTTPETRRRQLDKTHRKVTEILISQAVNHEIEWPEFLAAMAYWDNLYAAYRSDLEDR